MASESPSNALMGDAKSAPSPPPLPPPPLPRLLLRPLVISSHVLSLPALALGIWLVTTRGYDCEDLLRAPNLRVAIAVGLFLVFVVSNFVTYYGPKLLMPGNMVLSIMLVLMLTAGASLVGTNKTETRGVPESLVWLRNRVEDSDRWNDVHGCLHDSMICQDLADRTMQLAAADFDSLKLSPVESGCCKPPSQCQMEYVTASYWKQINGSTARTKVVSSYGDCKAWSNESSGLCYNCRSCKKGFLRAVASGWRKNGVCLIVISSLLAAVHMVRFVLLMTERNKA